MPYQLGVDLGTTYTAAAIARDGRVETVTLGTRSVSVPSVVCLAGEQLLVGEAAARRAITDPERVAREFKRRVGDPTPVLLGGTPMAAELLMARLLQWVVEQVSATEGAPPDSLAVTHPANWHDYKLDLLRQAVRHVGLDVDRFIPEPVAAATMYASQRALEPGTVVAVYDLGGGTFDAAVVRAQAGGGFEIVGRPEGIERLGGIDFDHAVFRHVLDALELNPDLLDESRPGLGSALVQLRHECVDAKEALSAETDVSIPVMLPERHTEVRLTRDELEEKIRPALAETVVALRRAIDSAGVPVSDVSAVLLVGGSSRIPLVGQMVGADLGRPIAVDARPKDAIPIGAALTLAARAPVSAAQPAPVPEPAPPPTPVTVEPEPTPPPAAPVYTPPPVPAPVGSSGGRWRYVVTGAAGLVVVGVLIALLANRGGDDPTAKDDETTTTTAAGSTESSSSSSSIDLSDLDTGSGEVGQALPGDDWSDAARTDFVDQCTSNQIGQNMELSGTEPETGCGCIYDQVSRQVGFAEFNETWTAADVDQGDRVLQTLTNATLTCSLG